MKALLFYLLSMLLTMANVSAQPIRGLAGLFRVGYGYSPSLEKVSDDMPSAESNRFSNHYMLVGWEGIFRLDRAIIGIEGTAAISTEHNGIKYSEPFMLSGHFRIGYIICGNSKGWLYPSVGTGPAWIVFTSHNQENTDREDYQLLSPSLDFGLNADFVYPRLSNERKNDDRFMVGIRSGYIYSFTKNHWRDGNWNRIPGMNSYRNNSFYITVVVGLSGFRRVTQGKK